LTAFTVKNLALGDFFTSKVSVRLRRLGVTECKCDKTRLTDRALKVLIKHGFLEPSDIPSPKLPEPDPLFFLPESDTVHREVIENTVEALGLV